MKSVIRILTVVFLLLVTSSTFVEAGRGFYHPDSCVYAMMKGQQSLLPIQANVLYEMRKGNFDARLESVWIGDSRGNPTNFEFNISEEDGKEVLNTTNDMAEYLCLYTKVFGGAEPPGAHGSWTRLMERLKLLEPREPSYERRELAYVPKLEPPEWKMHPERFDFRKEYRVDRFGDPFIEFVRYRK